MGRTSRRIGWFLACLLACVVALGAAPGVAWAETVPTKYIDTNDTERTVKATVIESGEYYWYGSITHGWYVATGEVNISSRVTVSGNVNLILADGANLTVTGGIEVNGNNSLTVYAQNEGTGKLEADASEKSGVAGIGGDGSNASGSITIHRGNITAKGGYYAAGIGGGYTEDGSSITITGGTVIATGGAGSAGIGGGKYGNGSNITISGGDVIATGGDSDGYLGGSGIGGGDGGTGSDVNIDGGTVNAYGDGDGAGIGGGSDADGSNITISNGTVTASSEDGGAGIGGGIEGHGSGIVITGGTVNANGGEGAAGIGVGKDGSGTEIKITGGCFASNSGGSAGTIYGIAPDAGYAVMTNENTTTSTDYPWKVAEYKTGDLVVTGGVADVDYTYTTGNNGVLTIKGSTPITVSMAEDKASTENHIIVDAGNSTARVTLKDVNIKAGGLETSVLLVQNGSLELTLEGENSLVSGRKCAGLQNGENPLTIDGGGSLEATGGYDAAGIGGGNGGDGSNIAIEGGVVTAKGGHGAAGIGGGSQGSGTGIKIAGGLVSSTIELLGDAIGNGGGTSGTADVTITGGAFADVEKNLVNPSDSNIRGTVYGIAVPATSEGGDGYAVIENPDEKTKDSYPVAVVSAKKQSDASLVLKEGSKFTYDGQTIDEDSFTVTGGDASFDHRAAGASGEDSWTPGLPTDAGKWSIRATVKLHDPGYDANDKMFYFGANDASDVIDVTIDKAPLTVEATDVQVAFAGTPSFSATVSGWVNGEDAELEEGLLEALEYTVEDDEGTAYSATAPAGSEFTITPSLKQGAQLDAGMGNYELSFKTGTLTVVQSASEIAINESGAAQTVTYGDVVTVSGKVSATGKPVTLAANALADDQVALYYNNTQVSDAATVTADGSFSLTYETTDKIVPAGSEQTLEVRYDGTDNQADASAEVKLTINKKQVTPVLEGDASKVYDATTDYTAGEGNILSVTAESVSEDGTIIANVYKIAWDAAKAGTKSLTATGIELTDEAANWYELASDTATATVQSGITKAELTVAADNKTVAFNGVLPELTYRITDFVGSDDESVITGKPALACLDYKQGVTSAGAACDIEVDVTEMSADNYTFKAEKGALTVVQSASEITIDEGGAAQTVTYGDVVTVSGRVSATGEPATRALAAGEVALYYGDSQVSDAVTVTADGSFSLSYDTTAKVVPAGSAQALEVRYAGTDDQADASAQLTLTISPRQLTATVAGSASKTYDGMVTAPADGLSIELEGVIADDDVSATASSFSFTTPDAGGGKDVTASGVTLAGDDVNWYSLASNTAVGEGIGTIAKATQEAPSGVKATDQSTAGAADGSISGVKPGPYGAEWRPADGSWSDVPADGTVTGLMPGSYEVRQKGDNNHEPSPSVTVTARSFSETHGGITYPDGTAEGADGKPVLPEGGGTVTYPGGTEVTLPGGTTVDPETGTATTPDGTTVTPGADGLLDVTFPDGTEVNVDGGSTVGDGSVTAPDGTVVAPDGEGGLEVTLPDGDELDAPSGSTVSGGTVTDPDGEEILPEPDYVPPSRPTYRPEVGKTDGGTVAVTPSYPHEGDTVTVTPVPDEGQEVRDVVVTDKDGEPVEVTPNDDGTYTFVQPAGRVTVTVTFACDGGALCPSAGLADVDRTQWYHDAVDWAVTSGAIVGYGDGAFGPGNPLTRAEMATVLWRLAGGPEASLEGLPGDCPETEWYAGGVAWALSEGVFNGHGDGTFGPGDAISREQVACVLYNRAEAAGEDVSARADLSGFSDAGELSGWAREAMSWAVAEGVFRGTGQGTLDPARALTRAEGAAVLMNWEARAE